MFKFLDWKIIIERNRSLQKVRSRFKMRFSWQIVRPFIDRLAFRKGWEEYSHCFQMGFSGESQIFTSKSRRKVFIVLSLSLNMMIWRDNIGSNMSLAASM